MLGRRYLMAKRRLSFVSIITALCIIGITAGISLLIMVISVMNGFEAEVREKILGTRAHINISGHDANGIRNHKMIIDEAKKNKDVVLASSYVTSPAILRTAFIDSLINVRAFDEETFRNDTNMNRYFVFKHGSADLATPNAALIGTEMAVNYALDMNDYIDVITVAGDRALGYRPTMQRLQVKGIYKTGYYEYDSKLVIVPLKTAQAMAGIPDKVSGVAVKVKDYLSADRVAREIDAALKGLYFVTPWMYFERNFFEALKNEKLLMGLALSVIILIASFNIATSQILFVKDKRREIAILKTLGLKPFNVAQVFFLEGTIIGFVGVVIGVTLGLFLATHVKETLVGIQRFMQFFLDIYYFFAHIIVPSMQHPYFPELFPQNVYYLSGGLPSLVIPAQVVTIALVSFGLSVLFAIIPAYIASKYRPANVLRYE